VNKTAASATQFAKCILYARITCSTQLRGHQQQLHIGYCTIWYNSIFGYKLRTD